MPRAPEGGFSPPQSTPGAGPADRELGRRRGWSLQELLVEEPRRARGAEPPAPPVPAPEPLRQPRRVLAALRREGAPEQAVPTRPWRRGAGLAAAGGSRRGGRGQARRRRGRRSARGGAGRAHGLGLAAARADEDSRILARGP